MKIQKLILICLIGCSFSMCKTKIESLDISKGWKIQKGDDPGWSSPGNDDKQWQQIETGKFWEDQIYKDYDGIAWYRLKVVIPSSLKRNLSVNSLIAISLGKIDDNDITFLNGKKIGQTSGYNIPRVYFFNVDMVNWDKENVITVRVEDTGGGGGMYEGPFSVGGQIWLSDILKINMNDTPLSFSVPKDTIIKKVLHFKLKGPVGKIEGRLNIKVYDPFSKKVHFQKDENIVVNEKSDTSYISEIPMKEPATLRIDYTFSSKSFSGTLIYSTLICYKPGNHMTEKPEYPIVELKVPEKSDPFGLENITFDGYLNERLNANLIKRLLNIDETGILECYYNRPGKQTWAGEYAGKYLHAASRVWRSTKNAQLKAQMDRIVDILISCQNEDGYLGTYLPANYWTEWDAWAHKYNLLGLLSYYSATGYKPALKTCVRMGDLLCRTFGEDKGQRRIIDHSPHMGMASTSVLEPMTYLYSFTGDKKYLDFCYYILKAYDYNEGPKIISTLTTIGKVNKTANGKAYEMMSNLTGIVKLYQLTGNEKLLKAAENAWNDISSHKLYITGTASKGELFQEDFVLPAGNDMHMGEGCVTTTWLQFSQALYYLTGECKYIDEIEKSIYNHLLAAENPQTGCVSYYTALQGKKPYRCTIFAHCCLASVPRGIAAIPELVYTKNADNGFSINIYAAGKITDKIRTVDGKEVPIECIIDSKFPEEGKATITLKTLAKASFRLDLRVPYWCRNFSVVVDGTNYTGIPGQYILIMQTWNDKSTIQVSFSLNQQFLDGGKSYPGYFAFKSGPQVLAFDQALNPEIEDPDKITSDFSNLKALKNTSLPQGWIGTQIYSTKAFYKGKPVDLKLVPFADAGQTGGDLRVWIKKN